MDDRVWQRALDAAQAAAREVSPDGWTPSRLVLAAAVAAALKTIREAS